MTKEITIKIHEIATDGLPDMANLTGRVAYIWDGAVVSGWPIGNVYQGEVWDHPLWEPSEGRHGGPVAGVTHWVEFPDAVWSLHR